MENRGEVSRHDDQCTSAIPVTVMAMMTTAMIIIKVRRMTMLTRAPLLLPVTTTEETECQLSDTRYLATAAAAATSTTIFVN